MKPTFFATPAAFRAWLKKHHRTADEVWVGYYRKDSGKPSITWQESVDEALCFGWIDGVRRKVSAEAYTNRFTPRRAGSNWSAINLAKVEQLTKQKRMQPAGLAAHARRTEQKSPVYTYEQVSMVLDTALDKRFRANQRAWTFFERQPPYYRKLITGWLNGAKREATRLRRLEKVMRACESGTRIMG